LRSIKNEIERCMKDFEMSGGGELRADFIFPEDFVGFQGHFPGNKILPGVCQIQCVVSMVEKWKGKGAALKEIVLAKFLSPVSPSEEMECSVKVVEENSEELILKASFSRNSKKTAEMKLRIQIKQDRR